MHGSDVIDLRNFYDRRMGQVVQRLLRAKIREIWPNVAGLRVLGLGYSTPYLRPFMDEAERVIALMPAQQGIIHWPRERAGLVALADETSLPLPDNSIDRLLVVHGLENSMHVGGMLREAWRVLSSGGKLLVVVPNRRGLWSRFERSPFGQGNPYSPPQLASLLRDNMFSPGRSMTALFLPPSDRRFILRGARAWERLGERWWQGFGGLLIMEADKQVFAMSGTGRRLRRPVIIPAARPAGLGRSRIEGRCEPLILAEEP